MASVAHARCSSTGNRRARASLSPWLVRARRSPPSRATMVMQRLRPAFTRHHALQCGFCTPGMLTTARDIVLRLPHADEARVRLELSGNLCRCTGYQGIVDAILDVLQQQRDTPDAQVEKLR